MPGISLADPAVPYLVADLITRLGLAQVQAGNNSNAQVAGALGHGLYEGVGDGHRTARLVSIAGRLLSEGRTLEQTVLGCRDWNKTNTPPLEDAKVVATVESIARTHARNHHTAARGRIAPLFDIADARVDVLLRTCPPPRRWLLTDFLPRNIVGMVVAPGGTGKSQLMLQLGVAVAAGVPLCELWPTGEQGPALLLSAEDDLDEVHRRLHRTVEELQLNPALTQALRDNLLIKSLVTGDNLMTKCPRHGSTVEPSDYVDRLLLTVQGVPDLKLIVVDPASRFRGGNENSADDVTCFVKQLERLREATGATVIVCHHANKAGQYANSGGNAQTKGRGSSAMTDAVRWQVNLEYVPRATDAHRNALKLEVAKSNYTKPMAPVILVRKDSGYLTAQHPAGVPPTLEGRLLKFIADEALAGRAYTANGIATKFGGSTRQLQAGEIKVRRAIKELVMANKLTGGKGRKVALPRKVSAKPPSTP